MDRDGWPGTVTAIAGGVGAGKFLRGLARDEHARVRREPLVDQGLGDLDGTGADHAVRVEVQ